MGPSSEDPSGVRSDDSKDEGRPPDDRDPDREMDALMSSAAAPAEPVRSPGAQETSRAAASVAADEKARELEAAMQRRDPESEMAALMGSADATPDPELHRVASPAVTRRRAVGLEDELFEAPARTIVRIRRPIDDNAAPRERVPPQQRVVAPPLPPALRRNRGVQPRRAPSLLWAVVAGVAIAGVIVLVQQLLAPAPTAPVASKPAREPSAVEVPRVRETTNARTQPTNAARTPDVEPEAAAPTAQPTSRDTTTPAPAAVEPLQVPPQNVDPEPAPKIEPKSVEPAPEKARAATNPRTPPRGTPADVAAVFAKLPVSPADLPPVGGIGRTGIHVDRIEMGSTYDKGLCGGIPDKFSLVKLERVNVCLRVVHPREEEIVSIVWEKKDRGTARRGKIAIKPLHAYRTRAYLVLRKEYVGEWTVRILSAEGVELAAHRFTIVP